MTRGADPPMIRSMSVAVRRSRVRIAPTHRATNQSNAGSVNTPDKLSTTGFITRGNGLIAEK